MGKPAPHDVVRLIMIQKLDILRDVRPRKNVLSCVFECPREAECTLVGQVVFAKGSGFSNPYRHLISCVSDGDEDHLMRMYNRKRNSKRLFGSNAPDQAVIDATKIQQAMYAYLQFIIMKALLVP